MNTYIFIGFAAPPLEAIPIGCWAEASRESSFYDPWHEKFMHWWYMVYPP